MLALHAGYGFQGVTNSMLIVSRAAALRNERLARKGAAVLKQELISHRSATIQQTSMCRIDPSQWRAAEERSSLWLAGDLLDI